MSIPRNSEKVMSKIVNRLNQAKNDLTLGSLTENHREEDLLVSSFEKIEAELQSLKQHFPNTKHLKECLTAQLSSLDQQIYKTFFVDRKDIFALNAELQNIAIWIGKINEMISVMPASLTELTDSESQVRKTRFKWGPAEDISEEWILLGLQDSISESSAVANLRCSYDNLSSYDLKLCLLCLSIFPDDFVVKKTPLIYWWIGEGLVRKRGDKTAKEVGKDVFTELIELGLITPHPDKSGTAANACKMHPWLRQMLMNVAKRSKFFEFDSNGVPIHGSRRACLALGKNDNDSSDNGRSEDADSLLTVFNVNEHYLDFSEQWLPKLKRLVVLQLGRCHDSAEHHIEVKSELFLKGLGEQKLLRYLSLRGISLITELPTSIAGLVNLEILDLRACHNLETLPTEISLLQKLTHLDVSECYLLETMPKGLEKLASLQVLKGFVIGNSKGTPYRIYNLSKLKELKELRKLSVHIGNEAVLQGSEFEFLNGMDSLRILTISWGSVKEERRADFNSLKFPSTLLKLDLRGIPLNNADWLKPSLMGNLKKLYVRGGLLSSLDCEERHEWGAEILRLKYLKDFRIDRKRLLGAFPRLTHLELKYDEYEKGKYKEEIVLNKSQIDEERKTRGGS